MTALIIVLSLVGYLATATVLTVYGARTKELMELAKAERRSSEYRIIAPDPVRVEDIAFPAMFWPVTGPFFIASGIHERRIRVGSVEAEAQRLRTTDREQLEKDNARLERELGIGGGS